TKPPSTSVGSAPLPGTLLGRHTTVTPASASSPTHLWQARLSPDAKPYPGRYQFRGAEVVPASVVLNTILSAAAELGCSALSGVRFGLAIFADQPRLIQVVADSESISLASSPATEAPTGRWARHVTAQLSSPPSGSAFPSTDAYQGNGHHHENGHSDP